MFEALPLLFLNESPHKDTSPMDLPAEVWRAEILARCAEYAPALRAVCTAWRVVPLPARRTRGKGLTFLAESGHRALIAWRTSSAASGS